MLSVSRSFQIESSDYEFLCRYLPDTAYKMLVNRCFIESQNDEMTGDVFSDIVQWIDENATGFYQYLTVNGDYRRLNVRFANEADMANLKLKFHGMKTGEDYTI